MDGGSTRRVIGRAHPVLACLGKYLRTGADPPDPEYRHRYADDMVEGFKVLSALLFAAMAALSLIQVAAARLDMVARPETLSAPACALVALCGGAGVVVSRWIRSARAALGATIVLMIASVSVVTMDRVRHLSEHGGSAPSLIPAIFSILMLVAAVFPLRPFRVMCLGTLLLACCAIAARLADASFRLDPLEIASATAVVLVSVVVATKSTSQRIRIHQAHVSALNAERQVEDARTRALLAETALTMERLAASLSHELNTPVGVLKSATETLVATVRRYASFANGSRAPCTLHDLTTAIEEATARLSETVARVQRFANLDRSAVRLVDLNQLVRDAVALMNPPAMNQVRVKLDLHPLPPVWCRPHALSGAIASVLSNVLNNGSPAIIRTYSRVSMLFVQTTFTVAAGRSAAAVLDFAVVSGRVRASGWDLFAARQLVREGGGDLQTETSGQSDLMITISVPAAAVPAGLDPPMGDEGAANGGRNRLAG